MAMPPNGRIRMVLLAGMTAGLAALPRTCIRSRPNIGRPGFVDSHIVWH